MLQMGVTSSREPNELGEAPGTHFDSSRHSDGLVFGDLYQTVNFPPNVIDKVSYLNRQLHKQCTSSTLRMRLQVVCGEDSEVVVGFGNKSGQHTAPHLVSSESYYLFNISRGTVSLQGKAAADIPPIPRCGNEGEVMWELDMTSSTVQYTVLNKHGSLPTMLPMRISQGLPSEVWPLVGVLNSGCQGVQIKILQPSQPVTPDQAAFEKETAFGELEFKNDGRLLSRPNVTGNSFAVINRRMDTGIHRWTIKVDSDVGSSLCLGLVKLPFSIADSYSDHLKHIYRYKEFMSWRSYRGFLYAYGNQLPKTLEPLGWLQNHSIKVEFLLNLLKGTLEIFKDGVPLGIAFENIRGPVKPAVAFYAAYEKSVELVEFSSEYSIPAASEPLLLTPSSSPAAAPKPVTRFDTASSYGTMHVSDTSVTRDKSHSGNAYCLLNIECTEGVYRWSFILESDQGASTCIGITSEPVNVNTHGNVYTSESMFLYRSFQGMLYRQGKELTKRLAEFWMEGSLVEVILDLDNGALQYIVNGEDQGVAFAKLSAASYRPIVAFYASMEKKITLVHFEHHSSKVVQPVSLTVEINNLESEQEPRSLDVSLQPVATAGRACVFCGARDRNVIALPCQHITLCVEHTRTDGSLRCVQCNAVITGVWNVF